MNAAVDTDHGIAEILSETGEASLLFHWWLLSPFTYVTCKVPLPKKKGKENQSINQ